MPQPQPWGTEISVATQAGQQWQPDVATNKNGVSLIVWASGGKIEGQRIDAFGAKIGDKIVISTGAVGDKPATSSIPSVTSLPSGDFAVAWNDTVANSFNFPKLGIEFHLSSQAISETGVLLGRPYTSDTTIFPSKGVDTAIVATSDGNYVAASYFYSANLFMQNPKFSAQYVTTKVGLDGTKISGTSVQVRDFDIEQPGTGSLDLALGVDGGLALSYTVPDETGKPLTVSTVRTTGGAHYFGPTQNLIFTDDVALTMLDDGKYIEIAAVSFGLTEIYATALNSDGTEITASRGPLNQSKPGGAKPSVDIATVNGNGYIGTWDARGADYNIIARQVLPGDVTNEFVVNGTTAGDQYQGQVTVMPDGRLLFVYSAALGPAYNDGNENVLARIWDGRGQTITGPDGGATLVGRPTGMTFVNDIILGGTGNDKIYGLSGDDRLEGRDGNDMLESGTGKDTLIGGRGNDTYVLNGSDDTVVETVGNGTDKILTDISYVLSDDLSIEILRLNLPTSTATLKLTGNRLDNQLQGNNGKNVLDGKGGADIMTGLAGDDSYYVNSAADQVIEKAGKGTDRIIATASYVLADNQSVETLQFAPWAATGNYNITGNNLANSVSGTNGKNFIDGKGAADILLGKAGADTFVFSTTLGSTNIDRITDFSVVDDTIRLSKAIFTAITTGVLDMAAFKDLGIAGAVLDNSDRIVYNRGTGKLLYDKDGIGASAGIQFAAVDTKALLTHADFFVV